MTLGVFDSGIGGEAVATTLRREFPDAQVHTVSDTEHMPYGERTAEEIIALTDAAIQPLLHIADVIVIACNTATTIALPTLRQWYSDQLFIGIEPMVKPAAAQTKTGGICVCATPATLNSDRYKRLTTLYAASCQIIEPDCSSWAHMIEHNAVDENLIRQQIHSALQRGADVIVLGCTHYHWIKEFIETIVDGRATVLEPSAAIGQRIRRLLDI